MAKSVGQILREARTGQEIELSEVERVTKIRVKFLLAMEQDHWDELPGPPYARGFLASYAGFLGLDGDALVEQYKREFDQSDQAQLPGTVIKPGSISRPRSARPTVLAAAALVTAVALGLVLAAALGGSGTDDGDGNRKQSAASRPDGTQTSASALPSETATSTATTTTSPSEVLVELRATDLVWVCLVDERGRADVNSETLTAGETRGPFSGPAFETTFGNGSVELTVNGEAMKVPALSEPLSYRITPDGARRLDPGVGPSCT